MQSNTIKVARMVERLHTFTIKYQLAEVIEVIIPTCKTSMPTTWSINPNLPGIELDKKTGELVVNKQHIETLVYSCW